MTTNVQPAFKSPPTSDPAVRSTVLLAALVQLRRDTDANLNRKKREMPKNKQDILSLSARKNGIQRCITEVVKLRQAANDKLSGGEKAADQRS